MGGVIAIVTVIVAFGGFRTALLDTARSVGISGEPTIVRPPSNKRGLLSLLTDDGELQHAISHPKRKQPKVYLVQVEGTPDAGSLERLRNPLDLGDFVTQKSEVRHVQEPAWLWPRNPPIRERKNHPTSWLTIQISEGKNRQVRRMTAAVGLPTLRLVRIAIGPFALATDPLLPGEWKTVDSKEFRRNY